MKNLLNYLEKVPNGTANAVIIWLHGLGADGHDFAPLADQLTLDCPHQVRYIFPHAPSIPVSVNQGMVMPAWYDIYGLSLDDQIDTTGIERSAGRIQQLIAREIKRGIDPRRVILAGFSQGGAVALQAALTYPQSLGGLLVLSSYFATWKSIQYHPANQRLPIAIMHGSLDSVVPIFLAGKARCILQEQGYHPQYYEYPMQHQVCPQQLVDINHCINVFLT